ncbi:hypothetical protein D3C80_1879620 [compost metagenome]
MNTRDMVSRMLTAIGIPSETSRADRSPAKFSAAKALAIKPARVIPIWIVARKRLGSSSNP